MTLAPTLDSRGPREPDHRHPWSPTARTWGRTGRTSGRGKEPPPHDDDPVCDAGTRDGLGYRASQSSLASIYRELSYFAGALRFALVILARRVPAAVDLVTAVLRLPTASQAGYPTVTSTRSFTGMLSGTWSLPTSCAAKVCLPGPMPLQVYVVADTER
jgi:hypothetical protein